MHMHTLSSFPEFAHFLGHLTDYHVVVEGQKTSNCQGRIVDRQPLFTQLTTLIQISLKEKYKLRRMEKLSQNVSEQVKGRQDP